MGYATFPFVFLHFTGSIRVYLKLYMCLHIIGFITIFVLPKFIRGEKKKLKDSDTITADVKESGTVSSNKSMPAVEDKCNSGNTESPKIPIGDESDELSRRKDEDETQNKQHIDVRTPVTPPSTPLVLPEDDPMRLKKDDCEMDKLSNIIREKIETETKNIEELLDNTVTETISNIAEFKNDLMRKNETDEFMTIRKRTHNQKPASSATETVDAFIKKEIESLNAAVQQTNVIPVVLGNGHAK